MPRVLLAGYFGCGNVGDDAILQGYVYGMRAAGLDYDFEVLSGTPDTTQRNYGLMGFDRRNKRSIQEAIDRCDALVFPGGSIFQDVTSAGSVLYYHGLVMKAKKANKKVLLLGQGVGPLTSFIGKRQAAEAFSKADVIAVRDPASASAIAALGVKRAVPVAADAAFLLPAPPDGGDTFSVAGMKSIGLAPRPWGKTKDIVALFCDLSTLLFRAGMMPVLVEMDREEDGPLIDAIEKRHGGRITHIRKLDVASTVQGRLARMDGLISMRLHAALLAATVGIAPLVVSYDPKTSAFAKLLGLGSPPAIEGLTAQRLFDLFVAHQKSAERNQQIVGKAIAELSKLAEVNLELSKKALGAPASLSG
jgi:polysaccharide pyruvyl transferase CsaB